MTNQTSATLSYASAGVDIEAGHALVDRIKPWVQRTRRPGVSGDLGGFGGLFELPTGYQQPVLVSGTDGVGTKLKLALQCQQHDTIGIDLVAMCVNDIVVSGAEPLFFLDYYATGQLSVPMATAVIQGIAAGCVQAGCALIGGETAEMPGMYQGEEYDLAGFAVGIVEKSAMVQPARIQPGDLLLGLASSGPHANGYSLIRQVLTVNQVDLNQMMAGQPLGEALLTPTRIYVKSLLALLAQVDVHGLAHITGGGLTDNVPRMLPTHHAAQIDVTAWDWPELFGWLQQTGKITTAEMRRTFNCGIGMVIAISPDKETQATALLTAAGESVYRLGQIVHTNTAQPHVVYT